MHNLHSLPAMPKGPTLQHTTQSQLPLNKQLQSPQTVKELTKETSQKLACRERKNLAVQQYQA